MYRLKIFFIAFFIINISISAQEATLYSNGFGKKTDPAVIYFHGGPGYNSANFEFSTAEELSKKGLFVVVFDQRGCGRSKNYHSDGPYTFEAQIEDVLSVYKKYDLTKASLIGHSWGGTLATKFAEKHPEMVQKIIFVGAPMSYQMTLRGILQRCKDKFSFKHDSINLKRIAFVEKMDTSSINYSASCFMFAVANGFYNPSLKSQFAEDFKEKMEGTEAEKLFGQIEREPVQGVYDAEKYTTIHLFKTWMELKKTIPLYGLYGHDDGLFEDQQLDLIEVAVGFAHYHLIKGASHNVFIDTHSEFMDLVTKILINNPNAHEKK